MNDTFNYSVDVIIWYSRELSCSIHSSANTCFFQASQFYHVCVHSVYKSDTIIFMSNSPVNHRNNNILMVSSCNYHGTLTKIYFGNKYISCNGFILKNEDFKLNAGLIEKNTLHF